MKTTYSAEQILEIAKGQFTKMINKELKRDRVQLIVSSINTIHLIDKEGSTNSIQVGSIRLEESTEAKYLVDVVFEFAGQEIRSNLYKGVVETTYNLPIVGLVSRLRPGGIKRSIEFACNSAITNAIMKYVYEYTLNKLHA